MFVLIVIVVIAAVALSYTNVGDDAAFVQHFLNPPTHFTYHGHTDYVSAVSWSPNGRRVASASGDGTVQVWDATTGSHEYTYAGHAYYYPGHQTSNAAVDTVTWSPDGKRIASGSTDDTVQIWMAS